MKITRLVQDTMMVGLLGVAVWSTEVRADITPFLDTVTGVAPAFTFNYHIVIGGGEVVQTGIINPGAPDASTAANGAVGTPGVSGGGAVFSDYFTIYDFNGYNGIHAEPAGWALSVLPGNLGSTPGSAFPPLTDNPALPNLTWYRTGTPITGPVLSLAGFSAGATGNATTQISFTSDVTKAPGDQGGSTVQTNGFTTGPVPPPVDGQIPEPATLLLLGSGLAGLAGWRRWQTKKV